MKTQFAALSLLSVLIGGCSSHSSSPVQSTDNSSTTPQSYIDDLNLLCSAVSDNYPALDLKRSQFGIDISGLCDSLRVSMETTPPTNDSQAFQSLQQIILALHDAHSVILPGAGAPLMGEVQLSAFGNTAVVTQNIASSNTISIGDVVVALDDKAPAEFHQPRVLLNRPDYENVTRISHALQFFSPDAPSKNSVDLKIKRLSDGKEVTVTVPFRQLQFPSTPATVLTFNRDKSEAVWQINGFSGQSTKTALLHDLATIHASLSSLNHLIIDLRKNGGGSTTIGYPLLKLLLTDKQYGEASIGWQFRCTSTIKALVNPQSGPDIYGEGCALSDGQLGSQVILKVADFGGDADFAAFADARLQSMKLDVLVGPGSFSTTESFARLLQLADRTRIVGLPSGGGGMAPKLILSLPKIGLKAQLSAVNFLYNAPTGWTSLEGIGVIPDLPCAPQFSDVLGSTDTCLDILKQPPAN